MIKNKLEFGKSAQEKMFAGIDKVYQAVGSTLGSSGKNVVLMRYGRPIITNDGVSIASKINLEDEFEAIGADLIKQCSLQTNEEAGDGTTTATILAYHLIKNGLEMSKDNPSLSPMKLKRELNEALDLAIKELDSRAIAVETDEDLLKIATLSAESTEIAKIVAEAVKKAGENGRVIVEESGGTEIEKEEIPGMELEGGLISPYMMTHPDKGEAILINPAILVADKTFSLNKDLIPLMDELHKRNQKELLVVCRNMDSEVLQSVIANRVKGLFHCVAVKTTRSNEWLEDLAAFTGATVISDTKAIKTAEIHHLGVAKKIVASKDKFLVVPGDRTPLDVENYTKRVDELKSMVNEAKDDAKKEAQDRLARLTGSVVVLRVGAQTEAEMTYLKLKIDDAVCATQAAVKEGYVTGGGLTLRSVTKTANEKLDTNGSELLFSAGCAPINKLLDNAGVELDITKINDNDGFDTNAGEYVTDLAGRGVIDPVIVEKSALKNAVSLASMFLTVGTVIADVVIKEDESKK